MINNRNFIILSTLSQLADNEKVCYASYREIVQRSGYCKTVVLQSIRELTLMGKIVKDSSSPLGKNRYRIID
jgi:hypothetical protein